MTDEKQDSAKASTSGELLPCPFCGVKPYYGGYPDVRIECQQCRQSIVKASWYGGDLGTMEASWNTRAQPTFLDRLTAFLGRPEVRKNLSVEMLLAMNNAPNGRTTITATREIWLTLQADYYRDVFITTLKKIAAGDEDIIVEGGTYKSPFTGEIRKSTDLSLEEKRVWLRIV